MSAHTITNTLASQNVARYKDIWNQKNLRDVEKTDSLKAFIVTVKILSDMDVALLYKLFSQPTLLSLLTLLKLLTQ